MTETTEGYCINRITDVTDEVAPEKVGVEGIARWAEERTHEAFRAVFDVDASGAPDEMVQAVFDLYEATCRVKEVARKAQYADRRDEAESGEEIPA